MDGRRGGNTNSDCGGVGTRLYLQRNLHTQASQVPGGWVEILRALRYAFLFALRVLVSFSRMAVISSRYSVVYMRRCQRRSSRQHFGGGWAAFWRRAGTEPSEGNLFDPDAVHPSLKYPREAAHYGMRLTRGRIRLVCGSTRDCIRLHRLFRSSERKNQTEGSLCGLILRVTA